MKKMYPRFEKDKRHVSVNRAIILFNEEKTYFHCIYCARKLTKALPSSNVHIVEAQNENDQSDLEILCKSCNTIYHFY